MFAVGYREVLFGSNKKRSEFEDIVDVVKRIAAVAGETIPASENGAAAATVPPRALYVLGDNPSRSTDSRVWGFLPEEDLVGRPLLRIWPVSRIGPVR